MKIRVKRFQTAQSLTTTLALAFFGLSAVALLFSGILQVISNFRTQQLIISSKQQLIAHEAARTVSGFIQEQFSVLETTVWLTDLDADSRAKQEESLSSLLGHHPAFLVGFVQQPRPGFGLGFASSHWRFQAIFQSTRGRHIRSESADEANDQLGLY